MPSSNPHFEGGVETRWLVGAGDDQKQKFSEFGFIDSSAYRWVDKPDDVVDGAISSDLGLKASH